MASSVVLKGLPDVPIHVLAYHLDKFLDTDEIGTFKVKELLLTSRNQWQIVINFKSVYDAFTAQSILQGFRYKWNDGEEYVLQAKVADDCSLQSSNWQTLANETWGHSSSSTLVPDMSQEEARSCNDMLDAKLELLNKQKLLLQTEREVVEQKRKLEKAYRKRHISDSEDEGVSKHRSRKKKRAERSSKSRVRTSTTSGGSGSKHRSKSRSRSSSRQRSSAIIRSVVREISLDHSRSRAVSSPFVREISLDHSRSRAVSRSFVREMPSHISLPSPLTSPSSDSAIAVYQPSAHLSASHPGFPEDHKVYGRSRVSEYFDVYGRPRSRYSSSHAQHSSTVSSLHDRTGSWDYSKLYRRSGSPDSVMYGRPRSYSSREYDTCNEPPDRFSSGKRRDKGRRRDDNEASCSKDDNTTTTIVDINICIKRKKPTKAHTETTIDIPRKEATTTETVTKDDSKTQPKHTENVVIKREAEYDNDNKGKDFKLQIRKAIREIMTLLQRLIEIITNDCVRGSEMKSIMKTLQRILARRLRFLPLDEYMVSDDIVHVYRFTHTEKDDIALIKKLIAQLSDPKIVIEDSDNMTEPPDADNGIWSIVDEVLKDFTTDCFSDNDDDAETIIIGKPDDEKDDREIFINETNIKTEKNDEDVKPTIANKDLIMEEVSDTHKVPEGVKKPRRDKKKICGPRNKIILEIPDSERVIPQHPKFFITVKNVLKAMRPYIHELCGDMNVFRVLDITTYEIRRKIKKLVQGKCYMRSAEITRLYRQRYPKDKDVRFARKIIDNFKKGEYRDLSKIKDSEYENDNSDNEYMETMRAPKEEDDDVIIIENNDVIMLGDEDEDVEKARIKKIEMRAAD